MPIAVAFSSYAAKFDQEHDPGGPCTQ